MSRLIAVGVGPGDPELITIRGVRLLHEADIALTPVGDRSETSIARTIDQDNAIVYAGSRD